MLLRRPNLHRRQCTQQKNRQAPPNEREACASVNEGQATGGEERDHELHEYCEAEGTSQLSVAGNDRDQEAVQRGTAVTRAERQPKAQQEHGGAKARSTASDPVLCQNSAF